MEKVRLAKKNEIEKVYCLFLRVKKQMEMEGNFTWSKGYPDKNVFEEDFASHRLFVFLKDERIIGTAATADDVTSYFFPSSLKQKKTEELLIAAHCDNAFPSFVLERFMIDPKAQKRGEGSHFLSLVLEKEQSKNCLLSVFKENEKATRFYKKNGFALCGDCLEAEWGIDGSSCLLLAKPFPIEEKQ